MNHVLVLIVLAAGRWHVPCHMNFPAAEEPCAAIVTRHHAEVYGLGHAEDWPYWVGHSDFRQVPAYPACQDRCVEIAPDWPEYAECCPSGPHPPPLPAMIFADGFESGDLGRWSSVVGFVLTSGVSGHELA